MKRKTTTIIMLLFVLIFMSFILCACGECKHSYCASVIKEPSCTEEGTKKYTCSLCGDIYDEVLPKLPHKEIQHEGKEPTFNEAGYPPYVTCSECDYTTYREIVYCSLHNTKNGACTVCNMPQSSAGLKYKLNPDGASYTVTGIGTFRGDEIVIGTYNDLNVTAVGPRAFEDALQIKKVTLTDTVTRISHSAFSGCHQLTEINIPKSVERIDASAFAHCTSLTEITIPDSVKAIGNSAFSNCTELKKVYIHSLLGWCGIDFDNAQANPLYYAEGLYVNGEIISDIAFPEGITKISDYSFNNYGLLSSVTIPKGVTSIGNYAFDGCINLHSVNTPEGITQIGNYAFSNCKSLAEFDIPDSVTYIGNGSFKACSAITNIYLPDGLAYIGSRAFNECEALTSIAIPAGVLEIGESTFSSCSSLTNVTMHEGITSIGKYAFWYCTSLRDAVIPDTVRNIGDYAFEGCSELLTVTLPQELEKIGLGAFRGCYHLAEVVNRSLHDVTEHPYQYGDVSTHAIEVHNGNSGIYEEGDFIFLEGESGNYLIYYKGSDNDITLPEQSRGKNYSIGAYAFYKNENINSITLSDGVTAIGDNAFYGNSSLFYVTLGTNTEIIGISAFEECNNLIRVELGGKLKEIHPRAFYHCYGLTAVSIPESVSLIYEYAFYGCGPITVYAEAKSRPEGWNVFAWGNSVTPYVIWDSKNNDMTDGGYKFVEIDGVRYKLFNGKATVTYQFKDITHAYIPSAITYGDTVYAVTNIEDEAFCDCTMLTEVSLPGSIGIIKRYTFLGCTSLRTVALSEGLGEIAEYAFEGCRSLEAISIPDSVTVIGDYAFNGCISLTDVMIGKGVTKIGEYIFNDCLILLAINVSDENKAYRSIDGNLYSADGTVLIQYAVGKTDESFTVPSGVLTIARNAFSGADFRQIIIPEGVVAIKYGALSNCFKLESISLPSTLKEMDPTLYKEYNVLKYTEYEGCYYLGNYENPYLMLVKPVDSMEISFCKVHKDTVIIANNAFAACPRLSIVVIPYSVKSILGGAFASCNGLTRIYYAGTESEWYQVDRKTAQINSDVWVYYYYSEKPLTDGRHWYYDENGNIDLW